MDSDQVSLVASLARRLFVKIEDVDHLRQVLNRCSSMLSQELINGAIDQWSKRLSLVIRSHDGHIEHRFA